MAKRSNKPFEDFDITKQELKQIGEAFKKREFVELFAEYAKEVNDPKNKALYESEIKQLERERGNEVTFIHPEPGYVVKTSVDGCQKAFVNICHSEHIQRPSAERTEQDGTVGLTWSVPYTHVKGRVDFDKKNNYCQFFDVVFHPDSIHLAKKNGQFKQLVEDTALSAVEDINGVKLDRKNLKYPKAGYKGPPQTSVIRKKINRSGEDKKAVEEEAPFQIPNYPYPDIDKNEKPKHSTPRRTFEGKDSDPYTTPVYVLKQRKNVEYEEFTNALDAKVNSSIPNELVVEIELPLVKCAADVELDIEGKSLSLLSEKSAKYKLKIDLPYFVDDDNGSAKFDKEEKRLVITLPVRRKAFHINDFVKEDSGIESDHTPANKSSSEEDLSKDIEIISSTEALSICESDDTYRTSEEVKSDFLKKDRLYMFPPFTISHSGSSISFNLDIKNVEPSSVEHQFHPNGDAVHMSFASLGSGCFPSYYAFFFKLPDTSLDTSSLKVEVWDNTLVANLSISCPTHFVLSSYFAGLNSESLKEYYIDEHFQTIPSTSAEDEKEDKIESSNEEKPEISNNSSVKESCDEGIVSISPSDSETSPLVAGRRSILKKSRSLSESHSEDYYNWSSLDSEDNNLTKKTVRFSDIISKKIFRPNSSILGQRSKNQKKSRNKKKAMDKRRSESSEAESESYSEMSEVSDLSDATDISESSDDNSAPPPPMEGGKKHRRRGSKNRRKNAASAKQNFILCED
ncbi:protein kintoun isoform X2 [Cimex lectularius]|uniref:Protein kintoun n=1 Tax=Cimex lectularius TaxID=79782 RepID=A0A8I6RB03_CIMLE|nr:protein kintoun isoform X2 [Cimex lectularius]